MSYYVLAAEIDTKCPRIWATDDLAEAQTLPDEFSLFEIHEAKDVKNLPVHVCLFIYNNANSKMTKSFESLEKRCELTFQALGKFSRWCSTQPKPSKPKRQPRPSRTEDGPKKKRRGITSYVFELIDQGKTNEEIAKILNDSEYRSTAIKAGWEEEGSAARKTTLNNIKWWRNRHRCLQEKTDG